MRARAGGAAGVVRGLAVTAAGVVRGLAVTAAGVVRGLAVTVLSVAVLAAAGCGGSAPVTPRPAPGATSPPARLVIAFWNAAGARRYRAAYSDLGPGVRRTLSYRRFAAAAARAHAVFARIPRVARVRGRGRARIVYVASARRALTRADAVQVEFAVRRYAAGWRITAGPFRTAAARARSRATRRARRPGGSRAGRRA